MSTRKDGVKTSSQSESKKKTAATKTSTRKREESKDRSNKKTEGTVRKVKPLVAYPDEVVSSSRVKPQVVKTTKTAVPNDSKNANSTAKLTKKSTVPVTPPSNRVSRTQFFPSKNMYSNALKSDQTVKVVASSNQDTTKKKSAPEIKKNKTVDMRNGRKTVTKNISSERDMVKKSVHKGSTVRDRDRDTYRVSKNREVSPDTSSTSDRPRTATLRKGSIVNDNIVGPDAPKPLIPKTIKEVAPSKSPEIEEVNYEDDFESYESDFEDCSSSGTIDLNEVSGEETSSVSSISSSNKPNELTETRKQVLSAGTEEDRKLDSGNYDMPDFKHKQILDNIKESVEKENAALNIQDIQRNNPASLSDEGFEEQKSLQFINFLDAKKKCEHRKSIQMKRKRGEEILSMIRLDTFSFTLFDLPSVPYETFIKSYGRNNTLQTAVQTGDDDVDEAIQTEKIYSESKWTQLPVSFPKIDVGDPNYIQICRSSYLGVGGDKISEEKSAKNHANELSLKRFLSSAGNLITKIQEESSLERYEKLKKNSRDIPFSDGYISFNTSQHYLKKSSVKCVSFSGNNDNKIMTVHISRNWGSVVSESVICIWSISNCDRPQSYFISYGDISCCSFGLYSSDFIYAGLNDGTISVWNTNRTIYNEDPHLKKTPLHTTDIGIGHKSKVVSLQPFFNNEEKTSHFESNRSANEICSLDEGGDVILWSLIPKNTSMKDALTNSTNWNDLVLVKNTRVSLRTIYPELEELQCTDCVLNSMDSNFIIVSTNYGFIIHHLIKGGRSNVRKFVPASHSCANCLEVCPFSPNYFLAGFGDGNINLYSRLVEKPLMVLSDKGGDFGNDVEIVQWSKNKPFVIYSKDESNTIHIWDLNESDMYPIYSIPFEKKITCMNLSPLLEDENVRKSYMMIGTEEGNLYLHLLNSEHGQQSHQIFKEHVNTFLKYVNRL